MPAESAEPLAKTYDPAGTEARWQAAWEAAGAFHPDPEAPGEPFCVVIPPPNVTGSLHMGHAFETALIDTIVRFQRLKGKNVLCLPGTDHASIAVQTILEKQIKAVGVSKDDLGRDAFLERAWAWKAESGGKIVGQLKRLGYSVDWDRERFTLDARLNKAVVEAFVRLHEQGLIHRGEYLVNWCPASGSAVSDVEVEMKVVEGHLWHFRYPLSGGAVEGPEGPIDHLVVATTRPETLLGDTGVAVNPADHRYAALVGLTIDLPLVGRPIPIVADDHVDPAFGTGCVKVTPAHDPNDFAIGARHGLPLITVMAKDGTMNAAAGRFEGLDRFEARTAVVEAMEDEGLLVKVEPHRHSVPFSDRGKVPVEPMLSTQWFVKAEPLAARCRAALEAGRPRFVPKRWEKVYRGWLTGLRDWCISRQLWWGHRIPAWFVVSETGGVITDVTPYVVARDEAEARARAKEQFGACAVLEQDPDVLDTWFSSGLWPFSTLGWPDESTDLATWYPTSVLVTGFDIIFFWVARMTMLAGAMEPLGAGKQWMPFKDVYIHGLVRDENNRKMSKSAGNGIDPLLLIERYGADALRFALVREVTGGGQDIRLDYDRISETSATVEAARNFANKLWNASRFALMNFGEETLITLAEPDPKDWWDKKRKSMHVADRWILARLARVNEQTSKRYRNYTLGQAAKGLYAFTWNDLCDWYLELIKRRLQVPEYLTGNERAEAEDDQLIARQVLAKVLRDLLVMLHPLMPHLTEDLWHGLRGKSNNQLEGVIEFNRFLSQQKWPKNSRKFTDVAIENNYKLVFDAIHLARSLRAEAGLKPSQKAKLRIVINSETEVEVLHDAVDDIKALTKASHVEVLPNEDDAEKKRCLLAVSGRLQVILFLDDETMDLGALRERLNKSYLEAKRECDSLAARLSNPGFMKKARKEVVTDSLRRLSEASSQMDLAKRCLADLG